MFKWKRQNQNEEISEKNNRWASLTKDSHIELLLIKSNEKCENKSLFSFEKQVYAVVELSGNTWQVFLTINTLWILYYTWMEMETERVFTVNWIV